MLTQEKVKQLFDYDPETGLLTRLITVSSRAQAGDIVGCDNGHGYLVVSVDNKIYRVHRIIWLWVYGDFPDHEIDHKNHIRSDNRISNLREATQNENQRNRTLPSNNTSGAMGVSWHKRYHKWQAWMEVNSKRFHLGYFEGKTEAITARRLAEKKYGFHENHGRNLSALQER